MGPRPIIGSAFPARWCREERRDSVVDIPFRGSRGELGAHKWPRMVRRYRIAGEITTIAAMVSIARQIKNPVP